MKTDCELNCWSFVSSLLLILNVCSDWYVYHCEVTSFIPPNLINWWLGLSILGTAISVIFWCLDYLCCIDERHDNDLRICVSQWIFLATLCEDLPLLIMSLITINGMSSDGTSTVDGTAGVANVLLAFQISSAVSLVVSLFRLIKVLVLGCPSSDIDDPKICQCYLCILYIFTSFLSLAVFIQSYCISC